MVLIRGQELGERYVVHDELEHSGAFGRIYVAWDREQDTQILLKSYAKDMAQALFEHEARLHSSISHKSIVQTNPPIEYQGRVYLPIEYLPFSFEQFTARVSPQEAVGTVLDQLVSALEFLHMADIAHHDIKPDNIRARALVDDRGAVTGYQVKLIDLGLAEKLYKDSILRKGQVAGTINYMAPEVFRGQRHTKTDIYAFGRVVYNMMLENARKQGAEHIPISVSRAAQVHGIASVPSIIEQRDLRDINFLTDWNAQHPLYPEELEDLVLNCLQHSVESRFDATHLGMAKDDVVRLL